MTKIRGFEIVKEYQNKDIKLPQRSTTNSAGYDFFAPEDIRIDTCLWEGKFSLECANKPVLISTGIKAYMLPDEFLGLYNRSSNTKNLGLILASGVNVIDSDYYNNIENEGHIFFMFWNFSKKTIYFKKGDKIGQGIFMKYLLDDRDRNNIMPTYNYKELEFTQLNTIPKTTFVGNPIEQQIRQGGFGSTGS